MKKTLLLTCAVAALQAAATSETIANKDVNSVLVVESGDSLQVTNNMSIATTAGATGIVTNRGTMTVKDLDLGKYGGGKGALAQFDNFGSLTVQNCLRMQIAGTPSIFYNHEGATVNKTGGSEYSFYFGVGGSTGSYTTLINEGDFFDNSKEIWMGQYSVPYAKNDLIVRRNGRFLVAQNMAIGHVSGSLATVTLNDNGLLSGKGIYRLGGSWQNAQNGAEGRVIMNDDSLFAVSNTLVVGCTSTSKGSIELNDSSKMTAAGSEVQLAYGTSSTGSIAMGGNSSFVHETASRCVLFGYGTTSTGSITLTNSAKALINGYVYVGNGANSIGSLKLDDSAEFDIQRYIYVGVGTKALGTITLAGDSRLYVTNGNNSMVVGYNNGATGVVNVAENAQLHVPILKIGQTSVAGTTGFLTLSDSATLFSTNITMPNWGGSGSGTLTVADNSVATNVQLLKVGLDAVGTSATVAMRGGSIYFDIDPENASFINNGYYDPLYLNPLRTSVRGRVRGWGKFAFSDPRTYVTEATTPCGTVHYGQIIADGDGVERDLDFSRFGALHYNTTDANPSGTNGWFAVNKGRLKMPRALPRKTANYRCVGDYWGLNYAGSEPSNASQRNRLCNTFTCTFEGAALNNYIFAELYATDRDDIPTGLDGIGAQKVISVWRVGLFDDGPEVDEPTHPSSFSSAQLHFKYPNVGDDLDGMVLVCVYRHSGTANGGWKFVGKAKPSTTWPVVPASVAAPSAENWNMGWFAVVARKYPFGLTVTFR